MVRFLKCRKSADKRHGSWLPRPMTLFSDTANSTNSTAAFMYRAATANLERLLAFAQDPARQLLQVLARAILRPVQKIVTLIGGQLGFE